MKLKKLLSFTAAAVVAVTALAGAMTASADTVDSGTCGDLSWTLDSEGVLTFTGKGKMGTPNVKDGTPEQQLDDYLNIYTYKEHKNDIKKVVIEEGATSVGFCSFYQMPNLESVSLPSTIEEFSGSRTLEYNIENSTGGSINDDQKDIASYAFSGCTSLRSVTLSEGIKHLGSYTFLGCTSLESVIIPKTIEKWGVCTFSDCTSLKNITLTDGLTVLGAFAFSNTAVQSIVIPSTIKKWGIKDSDLGIGATSTTFRDNANCAFINCKKLSSVKFVDGLQEISQAVFTGCTSLKKAVIPSSVTDMRYAFFSCTGLEEAYIEEGSQLFRHSSSTATGEVASGIDSAFSKCTNLKRLEIPAGVYLDYTNPGWINKCSSLTDIYLHDKNYRMGLPDGGGTPKFHCYFDSTTYETLTNPYKNNVPEERLVNIEGEISAYKDTIQSRLNDAKSYDEAQYTPESYGVLKALIEKAEKYGDDSNIMEMQETASDIRAAIKALEKKPDEPVTDPTSDDKSDPTNSSNNTSDSSNNKPTPPAKTEPTTAKTPVQNNNSVTKKPANKMPSTPKVTAQKPAKVKAVKLIAKKKKLNVKWKKVSGATGYEVMYATNNKFTKNKKTVKVKKNKVTLKRLKSKKKYYVKVRAYKKANGDTNYGKWSKVVKKKAK